MRRSPAKILKQASDLAFAIPRERLHPAVLDWAADRRATETWAVAFSGGADSLALLLLLWAHWPERREKLVALHFNHRLRGRAATTDEVFCRRICARLKVDLRVGKWLDARKGASEAEARAARLLFFDRELERSKARALWFGHQQDDIAETMFMRLARGSGASGLAAPRPVQRLGTRRVHLRPLLSWKKKEIIQALRKAGITWREDATNAGGDFFRNRVRNSVIPAWSKSAGERDAMAGAALTRELLEEDDVALEAWLDELMPRLKGKRGPLDLSKLKGKPRALQRRALHRWLLSEPRAGAISRQGFNLLLRAVERAQPTRQSLGVAGFAMIAGQRLKFQSVLRKSRRRK